MATATQKLESITNDEEQLSSDIENKSTAAETSSTPEHVDEKYIMVFDVEHTGCTDAHILQLSWGLYKRDGNLIETKDYFLKISKHIFIHPRAIEKHKITCEVLLQKTNTLELTELLKQFTTDVSRCETLVAHNVKCDLKTLNNELFRNNMSELNASTYCTMAQSKTFCNSKDKRGSMKFPTLNELHQKLFNVPMDSTQAHNSCYDVEICAKCYFKYINMNI